jgi:hypothetical protein
MSAEKQFWDWFLRHEARLFDFDPQRELERELIFDNLAAELQKIDPNLTFEFGPRDIRREFVISAGGIKGSFPAVSALTSAAPDLHRWKIIAFRPRRTPINIVEFGGKWVDPKDVQFTLLDDGRLAAIYLFIPGFQEDDIALRQAGYLLLDEALGEYDVETQLGGIKMLPPDEKTGGDRDALVHLPKRFDDLVSKLEGRLGKPS